VATGATLLLEDTLAAACANGSLNKHKLDNLANEIWKSAERLRGKFKAYEYQNVILPIIVIRRLECVLLKWCEDKKAEIRAKQPKRSGWFVRPVLCHRKFSSRLGSVAAITSLVSAAR
jgi:type I restriction-modification system DNA methylase subunit